MKEEVLLEFIIGTLGTILTIFFAYLAFKRNQNQDLTSKAKDDGVLLSDIKYIKVGIERMESKIDRLDNNYNDLLSRVIILEEKVEGHL